MPTIERLAPQDARSAALWDTFVMAHPQATFFHRSAWQVILREVFHHDTHFLFAHEAGRVTGVLPLAHMKSLLFGNSLTSLPFAVYGGVVAEDETTAAALEAEAQKLAQQLQVDHLELRQLQRQHEGWPRQELYVTFRKEILPEEEANMLAIPRKQRAMVRKGIKNNLKSELDPGVDRFFALYADNVHRHGTPALSRRYFEALRKHFGEDCEVLTVTGPEGQLLSSVLSFYFQVYLNLWLSSTSCYFSRRLLSTWSFSDYSYCCLSRRFSSAFFLSISACFFYSSSIWLLSLSISLFLIWLILKVCCS